MDNPKDYQNSLGFLEMATLELVHLRASGATSPPNPSPPPPPPPPASQAKGDTGIIIGMIGKEGFGNNIFPRSGFGKESAGLEKGDGMARGSVKFPTFITTRTPPQPQRTSSASAPAPAAATVDMTIGLELGADRTMGGQEVEEQESGDVAEAEQTKRDDNTTTTTVEIRPRLIREGERPTLSTTDPKISISEGRDEEEKEVGAETYHPIATTGHFPATHSQRSNSNTHPHPPDGYTPTPFYFTLVKALTGKRKR